MRVLAGSADQGACGLYRIVAPASVLQQHGHDVTIADPDGRDSLAAAFDSSNPDRVLGFARPVGYDVVVLQRPMRAHRLSLVRALQRAGVAVVVEIDDDADAVHPAHPAYRGHHPHWHLDGDPDARYAPGQEPPGPARWRYDSREHAEQGAHWLAACAELADMVTVSTPALAAKYGSHGRVRVLRNMLPEQWFNLPTREQRDGPPVLGWTGNTRTHVGDLEQTDGAIPHVLAQTGARLRLLGEQPTAAQQLRLDQDPEFAPRVPIADYPAAYAQLDVAIVPLSPGPFNEAKSALKGIEAAAARVPFVASPTSEYRLLTRQGAGQIARKRAHWTTRLTRLLRDPDHREEQADRAYQTVRRHYRLQDHAHHWWDAWEQALANRRAAGRAA